MAASLGLLAAGIALRLLDPLALLFGGSLLAGAAIALANVLLPSFVKREFVRPGAVMGLYSASLNLGAAAAAVATVPLAEFLRLDWRGALGLWLLLAAAALLLWLLVTGSGRRRPSGPPPRPFGSAWTLLRQPLARQVTGYLGLQSVQFYSVAAWLPTLLADSGVPVRTGGLLLGLAYLAGAAGALLAPAQAGRMRTQRPLIGAIAAVYVVGLGGLLLTPGSGTLLWVAAFGLAQGSGFALALTLIVLRSPDPQTAARLGGVAQGVGYLVAAAGPVVLGVAYDLTGGWSWPVALLLAALVPMTWWGWGAARDTVLAVPSGVAAPPPPARAAG